MRRTLLVLASSLALALTGLNAPAEAAAPKLSIANASIKEGASGSRSLVFKVRLANPTGRKVAVDYTARAGTARAGSDYIAVSGTVAFSGTTTVRKVAVPVIGDLKVEPTETLRVVLSGASGAGIDDGVGAGRIVADDARLSVAVVNEGMGSVASDPAGISCPAICAKVYPLGASVTLTQTPSAHHEFQGWSGGGCSGTGSCTVQLTALETTVAAEYTLEHHQLVLLQDGDGNGWVTSDPPGIDSEAADFDGLFEHGTIVTLTATPGSRSEFTGWGGPCTGSSPVCMLTMDQARSVTATFTFLNEPPVAVDDTSETPEDNAMFMPRSVLLANDLDGDGDPLSLVGVSNPTNGSVQLFPGDLIMFVPAPEFSGIATFDYLLSDGHDTDTGTVYVSVTPVNDPPVAGDDVATTTEGQSVEISVLGNDSDPEGDSIAVNGSNPGEHGTAFCFTPTVCTYTPDPGFVGTDTFTYQITDRPGSGDGMQTLGTVTVTVEPAPATFTLHAQPGGVGQGNVTSDPAGIDCGIGSMCSAPFAPGTVVTLTAVPQPGSVFSGWGGPHGSRCTEPGTSCTVTVDEELFILAVFD